MTPFTLEPKRGIRGGSKSARGIEVCKTASVNERGIEPIAGSNPPSRIPFREGSDPAIAGSNPPIVECKHNWGIGPRNLTQAHPVNWYRVLWEARKSAKNCLWCCLLGMGETAAKSSILTTYRKRRNRNQNYKTTSIMYSTCTVCVHTLCRTRTVCASIVLTVLYSNVGIARETNDLRVGYCAHSMTSLPLYCRVRSRSGSSVTAAWSLLRLAPLWI